MAIRSKATLTILTFIGLLAMADLVPAFRDYKVMDWTTLPSVLDFVDRKPSSAPEQEEHQRLHPPTDPPKHTRHPIIEARQGLDAFHRALRQVELKKPGSAVRILHYGDSPTTADLITADARALLQQRFGDGGHGFVLIAKPWAWYEHRGVTITAEGWTAEAATQANSRDGHFGLGAVAIDGEAGAVSRLRLRDKSHTRLEVAYLKQPGGGKFTVHADDRELGAVDTSGDAKASGFADFSIPVGSGSFTIRVTSGSVRIFGVNFEKDGPGIIYNSLGVNGAYSSMLARFVSEAHWAEQMRHYRPDLVIINYGTNESVYAAFVDKQAARETREIIRRIRTAIPEASVMVMSPMDRGQRGDSGDIVTVPAIPRLVRIQAALAAESGCAFFNTFEAMGGDGTMGRWYAAEPRLVGADFIHPMPNGAKIVGGLLYQALVDGYNSYKIRLLKQAQVKKIEAGN